MGKVLELHRLFVRMLEQVRSIPVDKQVGILELVQVQRRSKVCIPQQVVRIVLRRIRCCWDIVEPLQKRGLCSSIYVYELQEAMTRRMHILRVGKLLRQ